MTSSHVVLVRWKWTLKGILKAQSYFLLSTHNYLPSYWSNSQKTPFKNSFGPQLISSFQTWRPLVRLKAHWNMNVLQVPNFENSHKWLQRKLARHLYLNYLQMVILEKESNLSNNIYHWEDHLISLPHAETYNERGKNFTQFRAHTEWA